MLYMVECRFNDPTREDAWSAWYSGPRIGELLAVPGFLASQRLIALTRPGRYYLAVHSIDSMAVFERPEYRSMGGGGFRGYQECITDWVRRFFTGIDIAPEVAPEQRLVVADAPAPQVAGSGLPFVWVQPVGENDRGSVRGLAVVDAVAGDRLAAERRFPLDVYRPLMARRSGTPA